MNKTAGSHAVVDKRFGAGFTFILLPRNCAVVCL